MIRKNSGNSRVWDHNSGQILTEAAFG